MERRKSTGKDKDKQTCNPNKKESTSLPYSFEADRITVHVSQGSIVDVIGVDAIVNTDFSDKGDAVGIGCIISDKAGKDITEEYRKHVKKHGPLKEGETVVTAAGKLPYKGVIHCVVPKSWSSSSTKEEYVMKLNQTILNIFLEAENRGFFKIAMPAIRAESTASTDFYIYAEVYLKSINEYCKMKPTHLITDVHFVDINAGILLSIRSACEMRKTLSSFLNPGGHSGKTPDTSGQVPFSFFADSRPFGAENRGANRPSPNRQVSLDLRHSGTGSALKALQIRSVSVPNEGSLLSETNQQVSLTHPNQVILGYPSQKTSSPENNFPCYKMDARPRGICLIISNREFVNVPREAQGEDLGSRDGTEIDLEKLADIFARLHFIVRKKENLKDNEMTFALMDIARIDHSKYDCFVCCILSHGAQGKVYGSNGITVEIGQLTSFVQPNTCPTLKEKPKIFFIQACQGPRTDQGCKIEADAMPHRESRTHLIPNEADFLLGYSTVSGYISYRLPRTGSLYIEKVVDMLNRYHEETDLLSILTKVNDEVSKMDILYEGVRVKQMPQKYSTLRRKLFFP
ncbi:hypothetical protein CHS0354_016654 [Potamilus streckersoni]|uniref:Caspase-8 n=1 Tax=Potamilus streckersoni TaxID=2493646 RepID=A0AAE0TIA2_9BIVA|nr:hypothetical protein CHS0354_016654 [Potamilus streckersoni]